MPSSPLTRSEAQLVSRAVADAEAGRATLMELAEAIAIAERAGAYCTVGILRAHMRAMVPAPRTTSLRSDLKSVVLGMVSGIITWRLLGRRD